MEDAEGVYQLCAVAVETEYEQTVSGSYHVEDEGYLCPNDAVGKFEQKVENGPNVESWLCEEHLEEWRDEGIIVEGVTA